MKYSGVRSVYEDAFRRTNEEGDPVKLKHLIEVLKYFKFPTNFSAEPLDEYNDSNDGEDEELAKSIEITQWKTVNMYAKPTICD